MKKRLLSLVLVVCMALTMLPTTVLATPISAFKYDQVPTNVHWSDDGDLMWESDYFTNYPEDFRGFQIKLRYTTADVEGVTDLESLNWTEHYIEDYGNYRDYTTTCPNMGDLYIPADAWYCFSVCAYGETDYADDGYAYWYYSRWSDWSAPKYFAAGDAMAPPANVKWDGAALTWTVADADNISSFEVEVYYKMSDGDDYPIRWFSVYPQSGQTVFAEPLTEHVSEDTLLNYGSRDYYFKVRAVAENTLVSADSPWAISDNTLTFNANGEKLPTPTDPAWDGLTMTWDKEEGVAYDVELYAQAEPDEEMLKEIAAELGVDVSELTDEMLEAAGFGGEYLEHTYEGVTEFPKLNNDVLGWDPASYCFRVRACSTDLSQYLSSEWSEKSAGKEMDGKLTLSQVTDINLSSDGTLSWSWNGSADEQAVLRGFRVQVWYKAAADDTAVLVGSCSVNGLTLSTTSWKQYADKDGLYSFSIATRTNDYDAFEESEYTELTTDYTYDAPDPVGTLTDLTWNGTTATWTFTGNADLLGYCYVDLYYCGADGTDEAEYVCGSSVREGSGLAFTGEDFEHRGEGVYKFKVMAYSSNVDEASHSSWAESPTMTYTKPSAKLDAPTGLYWDGRTMKWDVPADTSKIAYYKVRFVSDSEPEGKRWDTAEVGEFPEMEQWLVGALGDNITFMLRAVSADANTYNDSDWVTCGTYYVPPAGLNVPTNLAWDGTTMTWDWDGGEYSDFLNRYMVALYYAPNADEEPEEIAAFGVWENELALGGWGPSAEESGLYYFTVYARSSSYDVISDSEPSAMSAPLSYTPAQKLAAPTDVAWNGTVVTWAHSADWNNELVDHYLVNLYWDDNFIRSYWVYGNSCRQVIPSEAFVGAGTYKVTVQAVSADFTERSNSVAVSGANLTYTPASADLSVPANAHWDNITMKWDAVTDGTVGAYQVRFYNPAKEGYYYEQTVDPGKFPVLSQRRISELGAIIYFSVRALTADANTYNDSDWVECAQTYTLPEAMPTPTNPRWEDGVMRWSWTPENDAQADALNSFELKIYYAEIETGDLTEVGNVGTMSNAYSNWKRFAEESGWYFFRVKACSENISAGSDSEWTDMSAGYYYERPAPVAAPTNLKWDGSTVTWSTSADAPDLVRNYRVDLYYCGTGTEPLQRVDWVNTYSIEPAGATVGFNFQSTVFDKMGSGNYRASVYAYSWDDELASDSETVWSDVFTYAKPSAELAAPTGLYWDGETPKWDVPADTSGIAYYILEIFNPRDTYYASFERLEPGQFYSLSLWEVEEFGTTLTFRVKAVSRNVNAVSDSAEAICTDNYTYTEPEQLAAPENFSYDPVEGVLTWDVVENAYEYRVDVFWRVSEDDGWTNLNYFWIGGEDDNVYFTPEKTGYYRFRIYSVSGSLKYADSTTVFCDYFFNPDLPKLAAPTELVWGKEYTWIYDNATDEMFYGSVDFPGSTAWKADAPNQGKYRICIYRVGETEPVTDVTWTYGAVDTPEYLSDCDFIAVDPISGTYYFTVQAIGDNVNYLSSDVAVSDNWVYTRPEQKLPTATDPEWDENVMTWTATGDMEDYYGFEQLIYFSKTEDGVKQRVGHHRCTFYTTEQEIPDIYLMENGPGYYWFTVRGISRDITKQTAGAWSELSDCFCLTKSVEEVNGALEDIIPELPEITQENRAEAAEQVAEAVTAVKEMDSKDLANAMAADQSKGSDMEEGGTLALIQKLEQQLEATGGAASAVEVKDDIADTFDASGVSVVGAALNAGENTDTVKLEISKVDEEVNLNPTLYTSAVQFSMHLTDGESAADMDADPETPGQQLAIPVRITLPVPANINPAFLVVLHHIESEDRYEQIMPYVYQEGGKWYASFVVTSFSDFALASVTIEAGVTEGGVVVSAEFAVDMPGQAICAVYDADGRMIGVTELEAAQLTAGERNFFVECDPAKAHTAKLFVLDGDGVPVYAQSPCVVS